jgi:hypothetical protein
MSHQKIITKYENLLIHDGKKVCITGKFLKYNPMPEMRSDYTLFLSGILMEGDSIPHLFLEQSKSEREQNKLNGKNVVVTGIFHLKQPTMDSDPEYVAKIVGSWIYNINSITEIKY